MSKKIIISIPDELLEDIDATAKEEHRSRSELIRESARRYLAERSAKRRPIDDPKIREALETIDEISKKMTAKWDSADVIRKMRDSGGGRL